MNVDRFYPEKPARLTIVGKLRDLRDTKLRAAVTGLSLSEEQRERLATTNWFSCVERTGKVALPLLDADSFRIGFVSGHDASDKEITDGQPDDSGNFSLAVFLYRDGSPFVYDEDLDYGTEYTALIGPDGPPTLVSQTRLEELASDLEHYVHGSWADLSNVRNSVGQEFLHPLSDEDCEHLLTGVELSQVNVEALIQDRPL